MWEWASCRDLNLSNQSSSSPRASVLVVLMYRLGQQCWPFFMVAAASSKPGQEIAACLLRQITSKAFNLLLAVKLLLFESVFHYLTARKVSSLIISENQSENLESYARDDIVRWRPLFTIVSPCLPVHFCSVVCSALNLPDSLFGSIPGSSWYVRGRNFSSHCCLSGPRLYQKSRAKHKGAKCGWVSGCYLSPRALKAHRTTIDLIFGGLYCDSCHRLFYFY